jgi:hypothetical protein
MKKILIYLSSFLFLFGASVAFANVYTETFEDNVIDGPWGIFGEEGTNYVIENGELHVYKGVVIDWYVIIDFNSDHLEEFIYKFEADIKMVSDNVQEVGLHHYMWEPTGDEWHIYYLMRNTSSGTEIVAELEKNQTLLDVQILETFTFNIGEFYRYSIIIHDNYITFGIDDSQIDAFHDFFQKPSSITRTAAQIKAMADIPFDIEYYADNIVAYTSTGETIYEVVDSVEESINEGDLEGSGAGASADGRLNAFENMLNTAVALFEDGDIEGACVQLAAAAGKCDGEEPPPDFVEGYDAAAVNGMIEGLMTDFGCE